MANELFEKWKSQFRKGFLELCLLRLLSTRGRCYGLQIMEILKEHGIELTEGTLYPLLMRMTKDGSVRSAWETPDVGHPRKYYSVTEAGAALLSDMVGEYDRSDRALYSIGEGR